MVTEMSKKYFPNLACSFSGPRAKVIHSDASKFVADNIEAFDVIIVDSTDPIGPGVTLFTEAFYSSVKKALKAGGIAVTQAESFQYHKETIEALFSFIPKIFKEYGYYWTSIPTYPSGIIGFTFLSDSVNPYNCELNSERLPSALKYYSLEMHRASFVIPQFAKHFIKTSERD